MENLERVLKEHIELNTDDWKRLKDGFETQRLERKTILVSENQTARHLYFIEHGLFRSYHLEDGEEINT